MNRLDWGCAFQKHGGWVGSDKINFGQEHVGDLLEGLPFPDDYFDYAVSHHAIQMFDYAELPRAISELRRVIKPGGCLRVSVPDPWRAFEAWQTGDADALVIPDNVESTLAYLAQQLERPGGQRRQRLAACQVRAPLALADRNLTRTDRPPPAHHGERDSGPGGSGRRPGYAYAGSWGPHRGGRWIGVGRVDCGVRRGPNPSRTKNRA